MVIRRIARYTGRALLCAGALAAGAATAHFTEIDVASHAAADASVPPITRGALTAARPPEPRRFVEPVIPAAPVADPYLLNSKPPEEDPTGQRFKEGRIIHGATPHRFILFTFDDGPNERTTPLLLDHLDRFGIKAVFFVTTSRFERDSERQRAQAEIVREIARRGHLVGSHTRNHPMLPTLDQEQATAEVISAQRTIEQVVGYRPWLFRPPGGARSARIDRMVEGLGYTQVLWNLGTGDFQVRSAEDVVDTFFRVVDRREREEGERGGVVLMHDTHRWTVDAFPQIVAEIRHRNCELLARGEELYDIVDDPTLFFEARQAGDDVGQYAGVVMPSEELVAARQAHLRERTRELCHGLASAD